MTEEEFHPWLAELGAYVLGALEPDEAEAVRLHLATCPVCQAEYRELRPAAGLLAAVPAETFETLDEARSAAAAEPDPGMWERLRVRAGLAGDTDAGLVGGAGLVAGQSAPAAAPQGTYTPDSHNAAAHRPQGTYTSAATPAAPASTAPASMPHARRSRRPGLRWPAHPGASAALSGALVAAAAAGIFVGVHVSNGSSGAVESVSAANASDGVSGTVQYHPTDWGSWVQVTLKGVPPGSDCVMYAVDGSGDRSVAGSWWAPSSTSQSSTIPGGVSMQASNIRQFVVETSTGQILLTVPVS